MPKYIIHIGPYKTGSTYLQRTFVATRETLLASGIHYPVPRMMAGHHYFKGASVEEFEDQFANLNRFPGTVLLSSEAFSNFSRQEVTLLRRVTQGSPCSDCVLLQTLVRPSAVTLAAGR
jgi:hypothetical protein